MLSEEFQKSFCVKKNDATEAPFSLFLSLSREFNRMVHMSADFT